MPEPIRPSPMNASFMLSGYAGFPSPPQNLYQEFVAPRPHLVRALHRPIVKALAGLGAQVAAADQVAEVLGRTRLIVEVARYVLDYREPKIQPGHIHMFQGAVGRHAETKSVLDHRIDVVRIGDALGDD